jgi:hypothetical protein
MNARIGRPPKGGKGEDSIFVATHLSGLKVRSTVAFKTPPAPIRKDPALRVSGKKGANAWNIFLSEKMDVRTPALASFVPNQETSLLLKSLCRRLLQPIPASRNLNC